MLIDLLKGKITEKQVGKLVKMIVKKKMKRKTVHFSSVTNRKGLRRNELRGETKKEERK